MAIQVRMYVPKDIEIDVYIVATVINYGLYTYIHPSVGLAIVHGNSVLATLY